MPLHPAAPIAAAANPQGACLANKKLRLMDHAYLLTGAAPRGRIRCRGQERLCTCAEEARVVGLRIQKKAALAEESTWIRAEAREWHHQRGKLTPRACRWTHPPLAPSQVRKEADGRDNGRAGAAQIATVAHLREDPTRMMVRCTTPPTPSNKRAPDAVIYSNCRRRCRQEGCADVLESLGQTYSCASVARSVVQLPWGGWGSIRSKQLFCAQ